MTATGIRRLLLTGTAAVASFGAAGTAQAQSTVAGVTISNQANASYTVNGTPATAASNIATFVVDRKVNLTVVAEPNVNTIVNLGQTNAVLTFRVTNNTNGIQDMLLFTNQNLGIGGTGTDNYDVGNVRTYLDTNNNGKYDDGVDQAADYIDELGIDASALVFVVSDVPNITTANFAAVSLDAVVATGGAAGTKGAALIPTDLNTINQQNEIDIVFADNDSDGTLGADAARNGQGRAYLEYEVGSRTANVSITKSSSVVSDGVNVANPKAIPGAIVQYCLTVANATPLVNATGITLTDVIPASTTYVAGSITAGGIGGAGVCVLNGFAVNDNGSPMAGSPYGGSFNASTSTVTATIPTLAGGASIAVSFRVRIN